MSVWREIKSAFRYTYDDGYSAMLQDAMDGLSVYEKKLFREEARYVLSLHDMAPHGSVPIDAIEQKIMERFAAEEAARA